MTLRVAVALAGILALSQLSAARGADAQEKPKPKESQPTGIFEDASAEESGVPAGIEATRKLAEKAERKISGYGAYWQDALASLSRNRAFAGVAVGASLAVGIALLLFGWAFLRAAFLPLSAVVGASTGLFMALEVTVGLLPGATEHTKISVLAVGAVLGLLVFTAVAWKLKSMAWMLVTAAPFLVASVLLYPLGLAGAIAAIGSALAALAVGLAVALKRRTLTVLSTAVLGTLSLTFCWSLLTYLVGGEGMRAWFSLAIEHPYALFLSMAVVALLGTDFQFVFGPRDTAPSKPGPRDLS